MTIKNLSRRITRPLPMPKPEGEGGAGGAAAIINDDKGGGGEKPFYDTFKDPDLKAWSATAKLTEVEGTVKQLREAQTAIGSRVALPKEGEDVTKWEGWDKLGAKAKAEDYGLKKPTLPEGMEWDKDGEKLLLDTAVKNKVPAHIAQGFLDAYAQREVAAFAARKVVADQDAKDLGTLFTEWGGEKDANLQDAQRAARHFGVQGDVTTAMVGFLGGAKIIKGLAAVGKGLREGGFVEGEVKSVQGGDAAKAEIKLLDDKYMKDGKLSPEDKKRRTELYNIAYPGKVTA